MAGSEGKKQPRAFGRSGLFLFLLPLQFSAELFAVFFLCHDLITGAEGFGKLRAFLHRDRSNHAAVTANQPVLMPLIVDDQSTTGNIFHVLIEQFFRFYYLLLFSVYFLWLQNITQTVTVLSQ